MAGQAVMSTPIFDALVREMFAPPPEQTASAPAAHAKPEPEQAVAVSAPLSGHGRRAKAEI